MVANLGPLLSCYARVALRLDQRLSGTVLVFVCVQYVSSRPLTAFATEMNRAGLRKTWPLDLTAAAKLFAVALIRRAVVYRT